MTPDRIFWNDQADEIILPTNTGQMGVLTNHAPLITALDIGVTLIRSKTEWIPVALMGGFALVKQNQVTILVNEAESVKTIQPEQAESAFEEAKNAWLLLWQFEPSLCKNQQACPESATPHPKPNRWH